MKRVVLCVAAVFAGWMVRGASLAGKYVALKGAEVGRDGDCPPGKEVRK